MLRLDASNVTASWFGTGVMPDFLQQSEVTVRDMPTFLHGKNRVPAHVQEEQVPVALKQPFVQPEHQHPRRSDLFRSPAVPGQPGQSRVVPPPALETNWNARFWERFEPVMIVIVGGLAIALACAALHHSGKEKDDQASLQQIIASATSATLRPSSSSAAHSAPNASAEDTQKCKISSITDLYIDPPVTSPFTLPSGSQSIGALKPSSTKASKEGGWDSPSYNTFGGHSLARGPWDESANVSTSLNPGPVHCDSNFSGSGRQPAQYRQVASGIIEVIPGRHPAPQAAGPPFHPGGFADCGPAPTPPLATRLPRTHADHYHLQPNVTRGW